MLNMGGIANFTYLPATMNPEEVFVTDTGTGNTLIDAFTRLCFPEKSYDKDAEIARQGTVNQALLQALKQLQPDDVTMITLFYLKEQSLDEIAEIVGIEANTVKVKLHRARKRLADVMQDMLKGEAQSLL